MQTIRYYADWLFKDLHGRRGSYVIAEVPNLSLIVFMVSLIVGVVIYPGLFQTLCFAIALLSLAIWSYREYSSGRSRFRKLLGMLGMVSVLVIIILLIF